MMTCTVRKFGVGVASLALVASMAVPALADRMVPSPNYDANRLRIAGTSRIDTAISVAKHEFSGRTASVVYLAGDMSAVDSATGGALADGPILLVKADGSVNEKVAQAVKGFGVDKVVALGGEKAVPQAVLTDIAKKAADIDTDRVAGKDRFETSVAIAKRWSSLHNEFTPNQVVLANGETLVDALTAGTLDKPILLTKTDGSLPESVVSYLKMVKPQNFIAVGGTKVVPDSTVLQAQYTALTDKTLSTDDSYPDLVAKRDQWKALAADDGALAKLAKKDALTATHVKLASEKAELATQDALIDLRQVANDKQADGKLWDADSLLASHRAKLDALFATFGSTGKTYTQDAVAVSKDNVEKYLVFSAKGIRLNEAKLKTDFVDDTVKAAKAEIDKYNAKKITSSSNALAQAVINGDTTNVQNHGGFLAAKEVFAYRASLSGSNFQAAKDTLAYLNLKLAGVRDQIGGKSYLRLGGKNRYATSAAISAKMLNGMEAVKAIYLVNGNALADATVAGVLSGGPVLLTRNADMLDATVNNEVVRAAKMGTSLVEVYAIGGKKVVSDTLLKAANATAVVAQRGTGTQAKEHGYALSMVTIESGTAHADADQEAILTSNGDKIAETPVFKSWVSGPVGLTAPMLTPGAGKVDVDATNAGEGTYVAKFEVKDKPVTLTIKVTLPDPTWNADFAALTDNAAAANNKVAGVANHAKFDTIKVTKIDNVNLEADEFAKVTKIENVNGGVVNVNFGQMSKAKSDGKKISVTIEAKKNGVKKTLIKEVTLSFTN